MKILMVSPDHPETFWSFKYALKFVSKKATEPPLGLLTIAAMLPGEWEKKLIDMNVTKLRNDDIEWADMVFLSGMSIQRESAREIIERCNKLDTVLVAGGPLFTAEFMEFEGVDHFVLNDAEATLPLFLEDLENECPEHIYTSSEFPSLKNTPVPMWELIDMKNYTTLDIQYSRGCPFQCEFCDISTLFGRKIRTKSKEQVITELDRLYTLGWRGGIFIVDDNFIGNKKKLKRDILPALIKWQERKRYPFAFGTEASIDLSDDDELMILMKTAGFNSVFIGIETTNEDSLTECSKIHNKNRDLVGCVKKMHDFGLLVKGGFIVGFDNDPPTIFNQLSTFIQESGVVTAMVGLLNAPRGSKLYDRLDGEDRLIKDFSGDNTDSSINFIPRMNPEKLVNGYKQIINNIYEPKAYYQRLRQLLVNYNPVKIKSNFQFRNIGAFFKSILFLGILGKERLYFWRLLSWTVFKKPQLFSLALTYAIYGFHFRKIFKLD
ncbi:MAG: B12-binding domain-containing radical SAM protein [Candidatus Electryonea clarkiae]|nr:B12-binding domain-containing radical SAM protein [Candidatus Electryonea clarkiae]